MPTVPLKRIARVKSVVSPLIVALGVVPADNSMVIGVRRADSLVAQ
ncbi:MAG: hypothetical protein SFU86_06485 [Pirellulaceae bacterium]|nr:hypothetical protein [Pirellulaceae bacterium]